jgi:hypothetical protein
MFRHTNKRRLLSELLRLRSGQVPLRPLKSLLLQVEGGLGQISGAAEIAPIVVVGAEGEDVLALRGEAEIGGDDGEDAFFGE